MLVTLYRNYFFDLDGVSTGNVNEPEEGMDALELAKQSEASLKNLLDLQDNDDDELLLQELGAKRQSTKQSGKSSQHSRSQDRDCSMSPITGAEKDTRQEGFDLLSKMDQNESKLLQDLMSDFPSQATEEDSPTRFSTQWNKLFGDKDNSHNPQQGGGGAATGTPSQPMDESLLEDLNLPAISHATTVQGNNEDDFTSFFSARASSNSKTDTKNQPDPVLLPSQLFDLDQSLFSQQSPRTGEHCIGEKMETLEHP